MTSRVLELARECGLPLIALSDLQSGTVDLAPNYERFAARIAAEAKAEQGAEVAWLCERGGNGPNLYVCIDPSGYFDWTPDVNKALRLSRREDADAVAAIVDDCWRVVEHQWG